MTFELTKELKEAGFPMLLSNMGAEAPRCGVGYQIDGAWYYDITLSELIEACETTFEEKFHFHLLFSSGDWYAQYDDANFNLPNPTEQGKGSTPEEAVARLWLALNKKEHA